MSETTTETAETEVQQPETDATETTGGDEPLGAPGVKALEALKAERKALKADLAKYKALGVEPDAIKELLSQQQGAAEREQQRAAEQAALVRANERIVKSEVKAAAKGVLADPADAYKFLDLSEFEVDDDGNVDSSVIEAALADLVRSKPYLGVQDPKRFQGSADGGARKDDRPAQVTRDDLARMSPAEITKARREGRLTDLGAK